MLLRAKTHDSSNLVEIRTVYLAVVSSEYAHWEEQPTNIAMNKHAQYLAYESSGNNVSPRAFRSRLVLLPSTVGSN